MVIVNRGGVKFGVEIEIGTHRGMTRESRRTAETLGWAIVDDGSVRTYFSQADEYRSGVYDLRDFARFKKDVKRLAKYFGEYNTSMGYHVHVSFADRQRYTQIFCNSFLMAFLDALVEYSKTLPLPKRKTLLDRWHNEYCRVRYSKDYFEGLRGDTRYRAINYLYAWHRHGTTEFRIFPSSLSAKELIGYTRFTLEFILDWVKNNPIENNVEAEKEWEKIKQVVKEEVEATPIKKEIGGIKKCALHG